MNKTSIHDMKQRQNRAIKLLVSMGTVDPRAIGAALKSMLKRYTRHQGNTSNCDKPHQGAQECARRRRQREESTHGVDSWRTNELRAVR